MISANPRSAVRWLSGASLAVMALGLAAEANAQAAPAATSAIEEVVVTGTRRTDRTVADSAVPIDVVSSETFRTVPATDMNNILKNVIPSFNVQRLGIADGSTYVRPPTMRGLPPDQILVLVNGKRFHRAALVQLAGTQVGPMAQGAQGVDLAVIPSSAVGRLEVLRDGASAQYGSDAIAGVMNFILNRNSSGVRMTARYGQFLEGDGQDTQLTANIGLPLGSQGFFNLSAEYLNSEETNRGIQSPVALAIFKIRPDLKGVIPNPDRVSGNPTEKSYKLFFNAGIDLDNGGEVYAFGDYVESTKSSTFNWRVPIGAPNPDFIPGTNCGTTGSPATCSEAAYTNSAFRTASFGAAGLFAPIYLDKTGTFDSKGNPIWDANGRTFTFLSRFPGGFAPRFGGKITDASIGGGYKGEVSGIRYDLFAGYGMNRIEYTLKNTVNASLGPDSPSSFKIGTLEQRELNVNADFLYDWKIDALEQPITLSAGAEYRKERYLIGLGDYASYAVGQYGAQVLSNGKTVTQAPGASGFGGFSPAVVTDRDQSSASVYFGAEGDLTDAIQFGAMLRYENYDSFGSTTTGKITGRYEFNDAFAVRGTVSTGFRAATPGQQGTYALSTTFSDPANPLTPVITGTYAVDSVNAKYFGAKDLKPEKAVNFSGGFVWQPLPRTTITMDYYNIKVRDRITLAPTFRVSATSITGDTSILNGCAATNDKQALACLGDPNAQFLFGVNYFANLFATRTEGVDLVATNTYPSDSFGQFTTTLAANWNQTKVTKRNKYDYNGAAAIAIEETNPKFKFNITENWQIGKFSTTARLSWYGKWKQVPLSGTTPINSSTTVPSNPGALIYNPIIEYGSEYTLDLDVTYRINDHLQFSVGAENILDRYPEKSRENVFPATGTGQFGSYYPGGTTISTNGAFWYTKLTAEF